MKFNKDLLEKRWFIYSLATCSAVLLYLFISHIAVVFGAVGFVYRIISPLVTGLVIAYIINPFVNFIRYRILKDEKRERAKLRLSVAIALMGIAVVIILLMASLIPQIIISVQTLFKNMDGYIESLQKLLKVISSEAAKKNIDIAAVVSFSDDLLNSIANSIPENLGGVVDTSISISKAIFDLIIGIFLAIYFLADKDRIKGGISRLLNRIIKKKENYIAFVGFVERCNSILIRYIAFDIIDGMIVGLANFVFMSMMGIPYSVLISLIVGLTNLAPTFGPIVGGAIGGFVLVLINPIQALWFIIFTIVLQTIDGYILKPRLFGESLGIPGVWILVSIVIGSRLFGVAGILLAIPFAAIVDFIYHDLVFPKDKKV